MLRVGDDGNTTQTGDDVPQEFQTLRVQLGCHKREASHVSTRASETFSNPGDNRISAKDVDRGYGQLQLVYERNSSALYNQKIDSLAREFSRKRRDAQKVVIPIPIFDFQVVTFVIAEFGKAFAKGVARRARYSLISGPYRSRVDTAESCQDRL